MKNRWLRGCLAASGITLGLGYLIACGDGTNSLASPAETDAGADGAAADAAAADAPSLPDAPAADSQASDDAAAPAKFTHWPWHTSGPVRTALYSGDSWYLGGDFHRLSEFGAPFALGLDTVTAKPKPCAIGAGFSGPVYAMATVPGFIYAVGGFAYYKGAVVAGIAKINSSTCALEEAFSPPAGPQAFSGFGRVTSVTVALGAVYVGGTFDTYRGVDVGPVKVIKLDAVTGKRDEAFVPSVNTTGAPTVTTVAASATALYVGGTFRSDGTTRGVAKLDLSTGAEDPTFRPKVAPDLAASAVIVEGSSVYYAGDKVVHKCNLAGDPEAGFVANASSVGRVNALAVASGALFVGGGATAIVNGPPQFGRLIKLDAQTGATNTAFELAGTGNQLDGPVYALSVSGGALWMGGAFSSYRGAPGTAWRLAKLDPATGALDASFRPQGSTLGGFAGVAGDDAEHGVSVLALAPVGAALWVGGNFRVYAGHPVSGLAKVRDQSYEFDTKFSSASPSQPPLEDNAAAADHGIRTMTALGNALYVGGTRAPTLVKMDLTTGVRDASFAWAEPSRQVDSTIASSNALYVGLADRGSGTFEHLFKLNPATGAPDLAFGPKPYGFVRGVHTLALSGDALYAGGDFGIYGDVQLTGISLAKLDATTGVRDVTFVPPPRIGGNRAVTAIAVAGAALWTFGAANGSATSGKFWKLNALTGAVDTGFAPSTQGQVLALLHTGTALYAGGALSSSTDPQGYQRGAVKANTSTGTLDVAFTPPAGGGAHIRGTVDCFAAHGSSLFIGGSFEGYGSATAMNAELVDQTTGALR